MPLTILIIESNHFLRRTLCWWLKTKFPACQVIDTADQEEAPALAQKNLPRVVIVDNALPGMSNSDLVTSIKTAAPTTHVLVLTFYEDEIDYANESATGVSAYISHENILTNLQPTLATLLSNQSF